MLLLFDIPQIGAPYKMVELMSWRISFERIEEKSGGGWQKKNGALAILATCLASNVIDERIR